MGFVIAVTNDFGRVKSCNCLLMLFSLSSRAYLFLKKTNNNTPYPLKISTIGFEAVLSIYARLEKLQILSQWEACLLKKQ